jgi:hypothetical protein
MSVPSQPADPQRHTTYPGAPTLALIAVNPCDESDRIAITRAPDRAGELLKQRS